MCIGLRIFRNPRLTLRCYNRRVRFDLILGLAYLAAVLASREWRVVAYHTLFRTPWREIAHGSFEAFPSSHWRGAARIVGVPFAWYFAGLIIAVRLSSSSGLRSSSLRARCIARSSAFPTVAVVGSRNRLDILPRVLPPTPCLDRSRRSWLTRLVAFASGAEPTRLARIEKEPVTPIRDRRQLHRHYTLVRRQHVIAVEAPALQSRCTPKLTAIRAYLRFFARVLSVLRRSDFCLGAL